MKVAVQCESPLLQRSLELFLKGHLSSLKKCDVVIRDRRVADEERPMLLISSDADADIVKPFSRSQLMLALDQLVQKKGQLHHVRAITEEMESAEREEPAAPQECKDDFEILQKRIELITKEYQQNLLRTIRAFYEK